MIKDGLLEGVSAGDHGGRNALDSISEEIDTKINLINVTLKEEEKTEWKEEKEEGKNMKREKRKD